MGQPNQPSTINLDTLIQQVTDENTVIASADTLLGSLKTSLDAAIAANDPAKFQAISDALGAGKASLSAAIVANTPADPNAPAGGGTGDTGTGGTAQARHGHLGKG